MLLKLHRLTPLFFVLLFLASDGNLNAQGIIDQATLAQSGEKTSEISTEELRAILRERSAAVLDIRPYKEYVMGHIPGALNVAPQPGVSRALYISDVDEVGRLVQEKTDYPIVLYCDGPLCEKSRRLADDLLAEGFTNVRRYQLGLSVWRALGGITQVELPGVALIMERDRTATFIDARQPEEFARSTLPGAINLPMRKFVAEKDSDEIQGGSVSDREEKLDDPPPIEDHSSRIIVFGNNAEQASTVAESLARQSYTNVSFFDGSFQELLVAAAASKQK